MSAILTVTGHVGQDPETRTTQSGLTVVSFSVATKSGFGDKQTTNWWNISVWDRLAESTPKFVRKGALVTVTGEAKITEYNGKSRVEVTGLSVKRLDTKSEGSSSAAPAATPARAVAQRPAAAVAARPSPDATEIQDDEIPW